MNTLADINLLIGRIIIGIYFLVFGAIFKIFNYDFTYEYMLSHEVPYTNIALVITIFIQFFCAIGVVIGWQSRVSAFLLAIVTLLINYYMHDFWNMNTVTDQQHEMQNFVKNLGIFAGLLLSLIHI